MKKQATGRTVTVTKTYPDNSGQLFDFLIVTLDLKNDAGLSRWLEVAPPVVSKVRHGTLTIGATMILFIHENACTPVAEIRRLIAAGSLE